jgi:hypothetical protein
MYGNPLNSMEYTYENMHLHLHALGILTGLRFFNINPIFSLKGFIKLLSTGDLLGCSPCGIGSSPISLLLSSMN